MATDLKERTSSPVMETIVLPRPERRSRRPLVAAAAIALIAAIAGGVLVSTQEGPPGSFPSLNTLVREGSGFTQAGSPAGFTDLNTEIREGSGYIQAGDPPGRGHVIPKRAFDPAVYARFAGTGHVPPVGR